MLTFLAALKSTIDCTFRNIGVNGIYRRAVFSAHAFLAGFTFEHVVADNFQRCKFALPKTKIEQDEQCARDIVFAVLAVSDERFFFGFGERAALFAFVIGQDDFLHGRGKVEIFRSHIENAAEHEFEFLCRSGFFLGDEGK